ncbi:putative quinol monooxygenase [Pararobbsia silviterrae]|uniref:putative quinol monooxygenase n=1 Tax=Pararobbsia silviterrae TaxID=1792498 RepID=UPI00131425C6|nr:antibiotic biosynthesis monooxygenase [Pararobbsia silviterrae]
MTAVTFIDVIPNQFVPGNEDKAQVLLKQMNADTQRDPGLVSFAILQETLHGNHFTLYEVWKDERAFDAHTQAAHTREFRSDLQPLIGSPYETIVTTPAH